MPRFVLLRHECPSDYEKPSHWDLMLEQDKSLATWELRELPTVWSRQLEMPRPTSTDQVTAVRLPDHRLDYLSYEGPLSAGRGQVHQCDSGVYELLSKQKDVLDFCLSGTMLKGNAKLIRSATEWHLQVTE